MGFRGVEQCPGSGQHIPKREVYVVVDEAPRLFQATNFRSACADCGKELLVFKDYLGWRQSWHSRAVTR